MEYMCGVYIHMYKHMCVCVCMCMCVCLCVCEYIRKHRWQLHRRQEVRTQTLHLLQQQHCLNSKLVQVCISRVASLHLTRVVTLPVSFFVFLFCMLDCNDVKI